MYHIYSQDHLPATGSVTVLTDVCTISTHKTIYHLLYALKILSLRTYVPYLLTRLFTIHWLCNCPYRRMYRTFNISTVTNILVRRCGTYVHKDLPSTVDVVHTSVRLSKYCPWTYVPHLLTRHLPSTGSVTVLEDVCTTSTHRPFTVTGLVTVLRRMYHIYSQDIYHPLALYCPYGRMYHIYSQDHLPSTGWLLSLRTYVPYLLVRLFTIHWLCNCPYVTYVPYLLTRHLPSTGSVTVLTDMYHISSRLFTIHWLCYCPYGRMYHIYSQDYLPSTGSATVLTDVCTTSTHKTFTIH